MTPKLLALGVTVAAGLTGVLAGLTPAAGSALRPAQTAAGPARTAAGAARTAAGAARPAARPVPPPQISRIRDISSALPGQNAEVEEAADPHTGTVYAEWIAAHGIGFARSTDGGYQFSRPVLLPRSGGGWDPAVAVAPDGTLYLTWDYGPSAKKVTYLCTKGGSCAFATGDLNVVLQRSTDGGKSWGPIVHVSPGFPASGGDSAPLLVEPSGRIDLAYQGYHIYNRTSYAMRPAHTYFTSSADGGATWSAPVRVGPPQLTMSLAEWWIDGAIGADAAGNLYITWDSQDGHHDTGWLSYSTDHGRTWSPLIRVTPDTDNATHIVQVAGGRPGTAYVGWLADSSPHGYAQYLRVFSIGRGWAGPPVQVSRGFGRNAVWPGDTFGIAALPPAWPGGTAARGGGAQRVSLTWGSAVPPGRNSQIYAAVVTFPGDPG